MHSIDRKPVKPSLQTGNSKLPLLIGVVIIVVLGVVWYVSRPTEEPAPEPVATAPEPAPPAEEQPEPAPDIPEKAPEPEEEPEEPLPPLPESDPVVRQELKPVIESEQYQQWLNTEHLLQKTAAITEGLSRGVVLRKVIPMTPPKEKFKVREEEDGTLWIDPASYRRYDAMVETLTSVEPQAMANAFHRFRPLLEEAYSELGQPGEEVDNTLIRAIDRILATPNAGGDIELVQESVYYQFADPKLESLPPVQKQMLRLGPNNREKVKTYLRQLRTALLELEDAETGSESE